MVEMIPILGPSVSISSTPASVPLTSDEPFSLLFLTELAARGRERSSCCTSYELGPRMGSRMGCEPY